MVDYEFVKQMHDWGCDISGYLAMGVIKQAEYDAIMGDSNESV
ncbi:XkdX family protein [Latilactobacillus sakei]